MKRTKITLAALLCVVAAVALLSSCANMPKNLGHVDSERLVDGEYQGCYTWLPVNARVDITVDNRNLTRIKLTRHKGRLGSGGCR